MIFYINLYHFYVLIIKLRKFCERISNLSSFDDFFLVSNMHEVDAE